MFIREKMRKDKPLRFITRMVIMQPMQTKDGRSYMLIKPLRQELRVSTKNSDSTLTDRSTSDQECQCKELLNAMEPTTFG
jgi:hypothetical protein